MYQFNLEDHISLEEYEKLCKEESKDELDNAFIRLISAYQDYNSDMIEKESLNLSSLVKQYRKEEKEIKVYITSILDEYGRYTYWHREVVIVIQWDSNRTVLNISRTILDEIIHDSTKLIVYCVSNDIFITGGDILYIYVLGYDNYVEKIIEIHIKDAMTTNCYTPVTGVAFNNDYRYSVNTVLTIENPEGLQGGILLEDN